MLQEQAAPRACSAATYKALACYTTCFHTAVAASLLPKGAACRCCCCLAAAKGHSVLQEKAVLKEALHAVQAAAQTGHVQDGALIRCDFKLLAALLLPPPSC